MPMVVDQLARDDPHRPWASVPYDDNDLSRGYEDITYAVLANAVNRLAWLMDHAMSKSTKSNKSGKTEVVAYYGAADLRYQMMQLAACKTGRAVFFSSHLNSLPVHVQLMNELDCKAMFCSAGMVDVDDILRARPMPKVEIPELSSLLSLDDCPEVYPYDKPYEEEAHTTYMYTHTSSTTGDPKPMPMNHCLLFCFVLQKALPDVEGRSHVVDFSVAGRGARIILPVPPYNSLSAVMGLMLSILGEGVYVIPYRNRGISATDPLPEILLYSKAAYGFLVPHVMETIARLPNPERYIKNFKSVCYGGGEISKLAAKTWSRYTVIRNTWGATEVGFPPRLEPDPEDYEYVYFDMEYGAIEFQEVELDDYMDTATSSSSQAPVPLYELVLKWKPKAEIYSVHYCREIRTTLPPGPPYPDCHIGDLWTPHPDPKKAHYAWRYMGRMDDVVTLRTGTKVSTGSIEKAIMENRFVKSALVVGNNHMQPLALIELADSVDVEAEVATEELWESVLQPMNARLPSQARIMRTHILIVPAMEFVRTIKGTVSKTRSERKFQREIDETYEMHGDVYQKGMMDR
ncbi:hypothetical protein GGR50DRAFT_689501 [Xylaria sp. CBS 124048]|nr:hypothetical protein GGR50DRAFT_689501 [Xylaria sp. CBS 124048]